MRYECREEGIVAAMSRRDLTLKKRHPEEEEEGLSMQNERQ